MSQNLRAFAHELDEIGEQCKDESDGLWPWNPIRAVEGLAQEKCENTFDDDVDCSECGPCLARKMLGRMVPDIEAIASRPHVKAVHDGQEYEVEVVCECGCRESVPFVRPDCAAECGRYMKPTGLVMFEEARSG